MYIIKEINELKLILISFDEVFKKHKRHEKKKNPDNEIHEMKS